MVVPHWPFEVRVPRKARIKADDMVSHWSYASGKADRWTAWASAPFAMDS